MTDTPEHDPPLTPQQEAAVRRALARAGGPEPMPGDVADRLDAVIAGLAAERATGADGAEGVDELEHPAPDGSVVVAMDPAARRRRTRVRVLLAAAAVVVVGGVAGGVIRGEEPQGDSLRSTPAGDAARGSAGSSASENKAAAPEAGAADSSDAVGDARSRRMLTRGALHVVRPGRLHDDLVALRRDLPARPRYARTTLAAPADFTCPGAGFGPGFLIGVRYDGQPALVAFRRPAGDSQVVDVLACGTGEVLTSTTLAAP